MLYNLGHEIDTIITAEPDFFKVTNSENETLIASNMVVELLRFYSRYTTTRPVVGSWTMFVALNRDNLDKMVKAINAVYNPIDNYNMQEESLDTTDNGDTIQTRTVDSEHNTTTATESINRKSTTGATANTPKTKTYTTTDDDATEGRLSGYTETTGSTETTDTTITPTTSTFTDDLHTTFTTSHTKTTVDDIQADLIHKNTLTKSGNIGVTTSQQMIESEINLRLKNIFDMWLSQYIDKYFFYVGGDICV